MAGLKHRLEDAASLHKSKRTKLSGKSEKRTQSDPVPSTSAITLEDIDFPRGGGTTLTPLEVKAIRAEAAREADQELFSSRKQSSATRTQRKSSFKGKPADVEVQNKDGVRIEQLSYKRLVPGMKVLGQVMSIQPLAIIVSLPNQLLAHVPITQITSQFTQRLESTNAVENGESVDDGSENLDQVPDLADLFRVGQYVRAVVISAHTAGTAGEIGLGRIRDDAIKASRKVELSLVPERVNADVSKIDLKAGFSLSASVKSVEDHGYVLDLGIPDISGFLSFENAHKNDSDESRLHVGALIEASVIKMLSNGRACALTNDRQLLTSSSISEVNSFSSVLPGLLVQSLVIAIAPNGLHLQILGFFDATADVFHLPTSHESLKIGQKVKTRVMYGLPGSTPPRFAVTLAEHHINLRPKTTADNQNLSAAFPVGTIFDSVKVRRVEAERGLLMDIQPNQEGFVHISHVSDDHVSSLSGSSGPWRANTFHKARIIGYHSFDGILQLSLRSSVLEQRFLQAGEVQVGEILKGVVKQLTASALFVSISGNVDGVVWPLHYADIPLKHPSKRFTVGGSIKCRVLSVDPKRNRIALTAKKTLIDTTLPILANFSDAKIGLLTHAVIFRVTDKYLMVEFFNNVKAVVPAREASETGAKLTGAYAPGRVIKVRIISVHSEAQRIEASIRQATSSFTPNVTDISGVLVGDIVEGAVTQVHKLNAVLLLKPSDVRALISFSSLARHWNMNVPELKMSLKPGTFITSLVVASRNPEKGFVVVNGLSKSQQKEASLSVDNIAVGQVVGGRVTKYTRYGTHVKLTNRISGSLHPTDTSDDYESGNSFPVVDSIIKAAVVSIDRSNNHIQLSTRASRLSSNDAKQPVDHEINSIDDLKVGDTVRGFIKSVAEHGLFVMLGREIDARVQIKELFDEYIKDWKDRFVTNQLVKGRILSLDTANKKVEMTFRSGDLTRAPHLSLSLANVRAGQKVIGRIKRIEHYGMFIQIEDSRISGLCHKSELSDNKDADVTVALRMFREGDRVKAFVISRDLEKKQLSLSLKPSYFIGDEDGLASDSNHPLEELVTSKTNAAFNETTSDAEHLDDSDSDDDDGTKEDSAMQIDVLSSPELQRQDTDGSSLKIDSFQWFAKHELDGEIESEFSGQSDEEEDLAEKKKRKKRKGIEEDVTADMQAKMPDSNADFERLLLGSPNSSYLWIQYMSFQLQLSEVDKARAIGKRAIHTVHFREEQEKLNVWIALLNLENVYGTDTTLEAVFKDAARHNDSKTIHLRLAAILDESQKYEKAEDQYKRTCKRFSQSSKVWTLFCEHYLCRGLVEDARNLLSRSLQSLEKRKHLKTISKFAQLEYKLGDVERGRTIFEGIVDSHPKRWDVWTVYMDMEAGRGDIQHIRTLFDHIFTIKMTSHKAKAFFKKWLDLEHKLGDKEGTTAVKQKAIEWTQAAAAAAK